MSGSLLEAVNEAVQLLNAWGRPAAFVGGMAFVARVRPRFTDDLDIAVTVPEGEFEAFLDLAAQAGFRFGDLKEMAQQVGILERLQGLFP